VTDAQIVLPVPEFSLCRTLGPYSGFENEYQGQPPYTPLYMFEGGRPRDPRALQGAPGIDPNLIAGLPGRFGLRCVVWLPRLGTEQDPSVPYYWTLEWRLRNLNDYQNTPDARMPHHEASQGAGDAETLVNPGARVIIPAATETLIYAQNEPAPILNRAFVHLRQQHIQFNFPKLPRPFLPGGALGVVQQGVGASDALGTHTRPSYLIYECPFAGDELLISMWREQQGPADTWDFAAGGLDDKVPRLFNHPQLGVRVLTGVGP
jgi:hypothetical protein